MFNKSKVMSRAHSIRKETGSNMSEALRKAWVEVKRIREIENQLFDLNMIDFQSTKEKAVVTRLSMECADLDSKINTKSAEELETQAEKNRRELAAWEEAEDIRFELSCIVRSANPDWERHTALRARLKEIA